MMNPLLSTLLQMSLLKKLDMAPPHYRHNFMPRKRRKVKGWQRDPRTGKVRR